jgi:hypothetical protein
MTLYNRFARRAAPGEFGPTSVLSLLFICYSFRTERGLSRRYYVFERGPGAGMRTGLIPAVLHRP